VVKAVCRSREKINENSPFCANFAPKMAKKRVKIGILVYYYVNRRKMQAIDLL
jgi:hypothetical protein